MRRWWAEARSAAAAVADRSGLWLPGGVAWVLTVGWIPLVATVARPPNVSDLTFLGARIYTSGDWPWNAVTAAVGAFLVFGVALLLAAVAEAVLVTSRGGRRGPTVGEIARVLGITVVTAAPAVAALLATGTAFVFFALREFAAPGVGDPLLRTVMRVAPFLVGVLVAWSIGATIHAAAARAALLGGAGMIQALAGAFALLRRAGAAVAAHVVAIVAARVAYLVLATILLGVLWAPISARLRVDGIDAALLPLLVGFVAIWLCLVLGGGALHAWGSGAWTRLLDTRRMASRRMEPGAHGDAHRS